MFKICETCKKTFEKDYHISIKSWKKVRFCSYSCKYKWMSTAYRGDKNPRWKGRYKDTKKGYWMLNVNSKRIPEHRYIMEKQLCRKLSKNEHVHHINGDKGDNSLSNLIVLTQSEHFTLHLNLRNKLRKGT